MAVMAWSNACKEEIDVGDLLPQGESNQPSNRHRQEYATRLQAANVLVAQTCASVNFSHNIKT